MRRVSAKRRALLSWLQPKRNAYKEGRLCVISRLPGRFARNCDDVHEIIGGRHRQVTERDERFWLPVARCNHDELQHMSKGRQWALKCLYDPENFSINAIGELPGSIVTTAEVLYEIKQILLGGQMTYRLPWPPSLNSYWRTWRGRMLLSEKGREYRKAVVACVWQDGAPWQREGRVSVKIQAFPPDKRKRDLDNLLKGILDSLQGAGLYEDDSQIDELYICRGCDEEYTGEVLVQIEELSP